MIEACLAHKKKGVKAVYDKSKHLEERKLIMQWWANHMEDISNAAKKWTMPIQNWRLAMNWFTIHCWIGSLKIQLILTAKIIVTKII